MRKLVPIVAMALSAHSTAFAQVDESSRDDTSDYFEQSQADDGLGERPSADVGRKSRWSGEVALTALYSTNADQTPDDHIATAYAIPSLSVAYSSPSIGEWLVFWQFETHGDFFVDEGRELNETALSSSLRASRDLGIGQLTIGLRGRSTFERMFADYSYTRAGPFISIRPKGTEAINLSLDAEYRFADEPSARRYLLTARSRMPLLTSGGQGRLTFLQEFRFSSFRDGRNDGRRDLRSSSTLRFVPDLKLAENLQLEINATLFHNFSNRQTRRFTDLEVGPSISYEF